MQVITFYIAILATFSSFVEVKFEVVTFLDERTLSHFIDVGYFSVSCAIHLYFTYFFTFRQACISETLKTWDDHDNANIKENQQCNYRLEWLPIFNGLFTVAMAIIKSTMYTDFEKWSLQGLLLQNSQEVSYGFFIWKPDHFYNSTLPDDYGSNLNTNSCLMGILGILGSICWNLQIDCFKDVLIWVAVVNKNHVLRFGKRIKKSVVQKRITGRNIPEDDDKCWLEYREIQEVNICTNNNYSVMFMINHLDSFLVFSFWLTELLNEQVKLRVIIMIGYSVVKGIIAYYPARQAAAEVCYEIKTKFYCFICVNKQLTSLKMIFFRMTNVVTGFKVCLVKRNVFLLTRLRLQEK